MPHHPGNHLPFIFHLPSGDLGLPPPSPTRLHLIDLPSRRRDAPTSSSTAHHHPLHPSSISTTTPAGSYPLGLTRRRIGRPDHCSAPLAFIYHSYRRFPTTPSPAEPPVRPRLPQQYFYAIFNSPASIDGPAARFLDSTYSGNPSPRRLNHSTSTASPPSSSSVIVALAFPSVHLQRLAQHHLQPSSRAHPPRNSDASLDKTSSFIHQTTRRHPRSTTPPFRRNIITSLVFCSSNSTTVYVASTALHRSTGDSLISVHHLASSTSSAPPAHRLPRVHLRHLCPPPSSSILH